MGLSSFCRGSWPSGLVAFSTRDTENLELRLFCCGMHTVPSCIVIYRRPRYEFHYQSSSIIFSRSPHKLPKNTIKYSTFTRTTATPKFIRRMRRWWNTKLLSHDRLKRRLWFGRSKTWPTTYQNRSRFLWSPFCLRYCWIRCDPRDFNTRRDHLSKSPRLTFSFQAETLLDCRNGARIPAALYQWSWFPSVWATNYVFFKRRRGTAFFIALWSSAELLNIWSRPRRDLPLDLCFSPKISTWSQFILVDSGSTSSRPQLKKSLSYATLQQLHLI